MATRKRHWLMKSEPGEFSIDDLKRVGTEPWTGVRNYQARNFMRQMQVGDGVLFYHSNCEVPGIYGVGEVVSAPYPDKTQFDRKSKRSEEHTSELQSLMRSSYAVFCLKKKNHDETIRAWRTDETGRVYTAIP